MTNVTQTVYVDPQLAQTIQQRAERENKSVSELYRDAMNNYLEDTA